MTSRPHPPPLPKSGEFPAVQQYRKKMQSIDENQGAELTKLEQDVCDDHDRRKSGAPPAGGS